ncbi:hypothetical protein BDV28DRAFT_161918 [Aspergillus coremiiformis]|uniref:Threonylcarbamoyl-AMP synthase n=1 Tax=Aspergillus coremiiformis TaxID=138285 RepID=A0A5N6Z476_9EURO|nr:hypothetical protein BDV28DRAFT_161918 [Aspergillus coremiiformis]
MADTGPVNIARDAHRVLDVLSTGGIAIIPASVGYGIVATDPIALDRIFAIKQRKPHKKHAMIGSYDLHDSIHVLPSENKQMVRFLTVDLDLPLGVIAPVRYDHPIIQKLSAEMLSKCTVEGTMSMLVNGGKFQEELSRLATQAGLPLMGSSANMTGAGTKCVVEDIEKEVLAAADIIIDYGRQRFSNPRPSSTMIDFQRMEVVRFGACYDVLQDAFRRFYGLTLPDDPGREALFSGHVRAENRMY